MVANKMATAWLLGVSLANGSIAGPQTAYLGQAEDDFTIPSFHFRSGEVMDRLCLHYLTLGKPHRNSRGSIDNAVLLLHSTGDDATEFLDPMCAEPLYAPGQPLDLARYYLIIPDSIGHGRSSKPSDSLRAHFPSYGYKDKPAESLKPGGSNTTRSDHTAH